MSVTISDVARRAGLSTATVSKYLNNKPISPKNSQRVATAIEELDYHINDFARGLRTSTSMTIGLLVPSINNIFTISLIKEVEQLLISQNYSVVYCDYDNDCAKLVQKIAFVHQKKVDGIIFLAGCAATQEVKDSLLRVQQDGIPFVFVNGGVEGLQADTVLVDTINAIYESVRLLISKGHQKIGMFALSPNRWNTQEREEGYRRVFADHHMEVEERLLCTKWNHNSDPAALRREAIDFLKANPDMTALLLPGYLLTLAGLYALRSLNRMPGKDIAVIGYDCAEISDVLQPSLAFVRVQAEEIAKHAVDMLLASMRQESKRPRIIRVASYLVKGDSMEYSF